MTEDWKYWYCAKHDCHRDPCPECTAERLEQTEREEYELSPEDIEFNRVMALYCGDDFTMQAGFQRAWLYLKAHEVTACNNYEALKRSLAEKEAALTYIENNYPNGIQMVAAALANAKALTETL